MNITRPSVWVGGWISPIIATAFTILWVLVIYMAIGNREARRTWQYGTVPFVPGQSVLTVEPVAPGPPPNQVDLPSPQSTQTGGSNARP